MTPITASKVYRSPHPAEAYDEPLEDAIRFRGKGFPQTKTDKFGKFKITKVPDEKFYVYVKPRKEDQEHLPGGDKSRKSYPSEHLRGTSMTIKVSSRPSSKAKFVGSTVCLACHKKYKTWMKTGHKLSWTPIGGPGPYQDYSNFPKFHDSVKSFKKVSDYKKGTRLEIGDYDAKRGSDKFKLRKFGDNRLPIKKVYADMYLWKSNKDGKYYITLANRLNPKDPKSPVHLEVKMLFGGAVERQRFIVAIPGKLGKRKGWYTFLQYAEDGNDARLNRGRRVWKDYKLSKLWSAGKDGKKGTGDDLLKAPKVNDNTIQTMCAACHLTGYVRYKDPKTGQFLVRATDDPGGSLNIDDDPSNDEINIGCEKCHGPGSEHVGYGGKSRYIVSPKHLSSERGSVLCGRCHDRRQGVGGPIIGYTQPINGKGEIMRPGESRHTLLTKFTDAKKRGPKPGKEMWPDDVHSKKPHQQYADFYKSKMYRNDRQMLTCYDCHNPHGTPYRRLLKHDPDDSTSPLCQRCHQKEILSHIQTKLNAKMKGQATRCVDCHMPGTMIAGGPAGYFGRLIKTPPYKDAKEEMNNAYFHGGINSHVFDVPTKDNVGVKGVKPGKAMPIPYTNRCGTCHIVNELPFR